MDLLSRLVVFGTRLTFQPNNHAVLKSSLNQQVSRDPASILALLILIGMIITVGLVMVRKPWMVAEQEEKRIMQSKRWMLWAIPFLALAGSGVAAYLFFAEANSGQVVCGPIGNCNTVQQSTYSQLFGIIPVSLLGLAGYIGILGAWGLKQFGKSQMAETGAKLLLALTTFGILFSIYLTFLEPFVIGAVCTWCLISAVIMTLSFWFSAETAQL
jgi:uncharacterized membrane protein